MEFPETCIKGIPNATDFVTPDGEVRAHLFDFKLDSVRDDEWLEQSINWEDNDSVIGFTLKQRKDGGDIQFKGGVTVLERREIDRMNKRPVIRGLLSYERSKVDGNPYHGNLLLNASSARHRVKLISNALALCIKDTHLR